MPETEAQFASWVHDLLTLKGWLWQHQRPARTEKGWRTAIEGTTGFPDIVAVRGPRLIFAELKSVKGTMSPEQEQWERALIFCEQSIDDQNVQYFVWRPSDRPEIEQVLD